MTQMLKAEVLETRAKSLRLEPFDCAVLVAAIALH
jgi:hypothetical protein